MRQFTASLSILCGALALAGCRNAPPPAAPADAEAAATTPAPAASEPAPPAPATAEVPAPVQEAPMGKRGPGMENVPLEIWRAFGNEPFWNVNAEGGRLVFTTPEDQAGKVLQGRRIPSLVGTVIAGDSGGMHFQLGITPGACSDGMSDNHYDHRATFSYGDTEYKGCAEAAK